MSDGAVATGESGAECWKGGTAALQVMGSDATNGSHLCYERRRRLLPTAASYATNGGELRYQWMKALLPPSSGVATTVVDRCYQRVDGVAACRDWSCYRRRQDVLPAASDVAANLGRHYYQRVTRGEPRL
jgi:hypothetical protein